MGQENFKRICPAPQTPDALACFSSKTVCAIVHRTLAWFYHSAEGAEITPNTGERKMGEAQGFGREKSFSQPVTQQPSPKYLLCAGLGKRRLRPSNLLANGSRSTV